MIDEIWKDYPNLTIKKKTTNLLTKYKYYGILLYVSVVNMYDTQLEAFDIEPLINIKIFF